MGVDMDGETAKADPLPADANISLYYAGRQGESRETHKQEVVVHHVHYSRAFPDA